MLFRSLLSAAALLLPGLVQAGCYHYEEEGATQPSPVVDICYAGSCDRTTVVFECGNVYRADIAYAVGWGITFELNGEGPEDDVATVYWQDRTIDRARWANLSCTEVSGEGGCRFFELLN